MTERRLILMRHATASPSQAAQPDRSRPLTPEGRLEARRMGERLRDQGSIPDRVLCSTAIRCRETWQALLPSFGQGIAVDFEDRLYGADDRILLEVVAEIDGARTLLVLAHDPGISLLARELMRAGDRPAGGPPVPDPARVGLTPGSAASFEVEGAWSTVSRRSVRLMRFESPPRA